MTFRTAFAAFTIAAIVAPVAEAQQQRVVALTEQDEAAYRDAFEAIEAGNWRAVSNALNRTDDDVLEGVVRGRLLLSRSYRADWGAYTSWLNHYGEYGMAPAVYDRAMDSRSRRARRRGITAPSPESGARRSLPGTPPAIPGDSASARVGIERVQDAIGAGDMEGARTLAYAQIGGPREGQAQWQLGLIAYRQHDYTDAARQFDASSRWANHGGWARAAAHYWAARSMLAAGQTNGVSQHLEAAAQMPWTWSSARRQWR